MRQGWIIASLVFIIVGCWGGAVGAWRMREPTQALHYLSLPSVLSGIFLIVAVVLETGWGSASAKTFAIVLILIATNSVGTHATARAIRVRKLGHWKPREEDGVEFLRERE